MRVFSILAYDALRQGYRTIDLIFPLPYYTVFPQKSVTLTISENIPKPKMLDVVQ